MDFRVALGESSSEWLWASPLLLLLRGPRPPLQSALCSWQSSQSCLLEGPEASLPESQLWQCLSWSGQGMGVPLISVGPSYGLSESAAEDLGEGAPVLSSLRTATTRTTQGGGSNGRNGNGWERHWR